LNLVLIVCNNGNYHTPPHKKVDHYDWSNSFEM
jgi:hypothetical protein